jgi:hypothetical protein
VDKPPPGTWESGLTITGSSDRTLRTRRTREAVPAICEECGKFFPSGIQIGTGITATVGKWGEITSHQSPCPACGHVGAKVLPGTWTVETIRLFAGLSTDTIEPLLDAARRRRAGDASDEDVIAAAPPEVRGWLKDLQDQVKNNWVTILIAVLFFFLTTLSANTSTDELISTTKQTATAEQASLQEMQRQLQEMTQQEREMADAVQKLLAARAVASGSSQSHAIGRNDPCPCGSGQKLRFCHGAKPDRPPS